MSAARPVLSSAGSRQQQFEAVVRTFSGDLYRFAYWLCGEQALAEDLVQETCLRAWRGFDALRDGTAAKPWLFTILRREHARLYERKRPETVDVEEQALPESAAWADPERAGSDEEIRQAMMKLPVKYREPLLMQVLGGFSCEEIAAALGDKPGAVMTQLFRARQQLKTLLGAGEEETHGLR
jgi:RNA polymerase sigma-70 factor (ECF subfamily)